MIDAARILLDASITFLTFAVRIMFFELCVFMGKHQSGKLCCLMTALVSLPVKEEEL